MRKVFGFILRFKELFAIAIILLLITFFKGCGKANAMSGKEGCVNATADKAESETNVDTMDVYFPIIEKAAGIISGAIPPDDSDGWAGLSAIVTTEIEGDPGKWMREFGWAVRDLDGAACSIIATYRYMPIIGDTPQYAVSYVDMLGHPVMKILMMSGMDGSLQLWDIP